MWAERRITERVRWLTYRALAIRQSKEPRPLCSYEGLTLETLANTLFTAFSIPHEPYVDTLYVLITATPTQTKASPDRD